MDGFLQILGQEMRGESPDPIFWYRSWYIARRTDHVRFVLPAGFGPIIQTLVAEPVQTGQAYRVCHLVEAYATGEEVLLDFSDEGARHFRLLRALDGDWLVVVAVVVFVFLFSIRHLEDCLLSSNIIDKEFIYI